MIRVITASQEPKGHLPTKSLKEVAKQVTQRHGFRARTENVPKEDGGGIILYVLDKGHVFPDNAGTMHIYPSGWADIVDYDSGYSRDTFADIRNDIDRELDKLVSAPSAIKANSDQISIHTPLSSGESISDFLDLYGLELDNHQDKEYVEETYHRFNKMIAVRETLYNMLVNHYGPQHEHSEYFRDVVDILLNPRIEEEVMDEIEGFDLTNNSIQKSADMIVNESGMLDDLDMFMEVILE